MPKTLPICLSSYQTRTATDTYNLGATSRTFNINPARTAR